MGFRAGLPPVVALFLLSLTACGGGGGGGPRRCATGDSECLLAALVVETNGVAVTLRTIDAALLATTPGAPGPKTVWSTAAGGNGVDGWDGAHWANTDSSGDIVTSVWAASPTDAWSAGYSTRVKHWDGTSWTTAVVGTATGLAYHAVWGSGPGDVYAGGTGGAIAHWNGSAWTPFDAGATSDIRAIAGSGSSDVWIGGTGSLLRHWSGSAWTASAPNASIDIAAITTSGPSEAWAVGTNTNVAIHWDGLSWTPVTMAGATYLRDVWESGASDVWAIAYEITQGTFLLHWDGLAWSPEPDPPGMTEFSALWGRSASDLWLGGNGNMGHWNGGVWTVFPTTPGLHDSLYGLNPDPGSPSGYPPSITNQPPPMVFAGPAAKVDLTLDWTDANGCTPAFCMQVCNPALQCSSKARCSALISDGLLAGAAIRAIGYTATPANGPEAFSLKVTPLSSADCTDPLAALIAGAPGVLANDATSVEQTLTAAPSPTPVPTAGSHDGVWNLEVAITSCYVFTHTVPITISGGAFSGPLFQYCSNPVSGATRLGNNDCGADLAEDVSVDLTVTGNQIDGNLTLAGGGCNGANGFSGTFDSATTGQAASFWGTLTFTK